MLVFFQRLWADVEQKKTEIQNLMSELAKVVRDKTASAEELSHCKAALNEREATLSSLSSQSAALEEKLGAMEALKTELSEVKDKLDLKDKELQALKESKGCSSEKLKLLQLKLEQCQAENSRELKKLENELESKKNDILELQNRIIGEERKRYSSDDPALQQGPLSQVCGKFLVC